MNGCRHYRSWLIAGGYVEWCYECGAFRKMRHLDPTTVEPASAWCRPVGKGNANPAERWLKRSQRYQKAAS